MPDLKMGKTGARHLGAFALLWLMLGTSAWAHDEPGAPRVALEPEIEGALHAGHIRFQFELVDTKLNRVLTDQDLLVEHEKKLHLFFFDPALVEFRHVHPVFEGGVWSVETDLPVSGNYRVWALGQLASDQTDFSAGNRQLIEGGAPANLPQELGDIRSGSDGNSGASLSGEALHAKQLVMPILTFSRNDQTSPEITPYLGAKAHLLIVSDDGDSIIHTHPMEMPGSDRLMIHAIFPRAGAYRVWVQFIDADDLKTVALSVVVRE